MKKIILTLLITTFPIITHSQVKIGLKLSPTLSYSRVKSEKDTLETKSDGVWIRGMFGVFADFELADNYFFNTGLFFTPRVIGVSVTHTGDGAITTAKYNIEYLQIPVNLKLYTDEIALDKRLYFQVGVAFDVKMNDNSVKGYDPVISEFKPVDVAFLFGGGLEISISQHTRILTGITYYRGLLNVVNTSTEDISIRNDLFALDLGIKF